jgi:hypothetical protein
VTYKAQKRVKSENLSKLEIQKFSSNFIRFCCFIGWFLLAARVSARRRGPRMHHGNAADAEGLEEAVVIFFFNFLYFFWMKNYLPKSFRTAA